MNIFYQIYDETLRDMLRKRKKNSKQTRAECVEFNRKKNLPSSVKRTRRKKTTHMMKNAVVSAACIIWEVYL
jgi:hypothetical protein